jgi:sec-independent protein translocase protein TatB
MFGMGFSEILIILVIAILFLGPDKLPTALVDIAKFFRDIKKTVNSVKSSIEDEMNVSEIKDEALAYKKELLNAQSKLTSVTDIANLDTKIDSFVDDFKEEERKIASSKSSKVEFKKESKEDIDV